MDNPTRSFVLFLVVYVIARVAISSLMPLMEFSEARYAEIARKLLTEDSWVTLWYLELMPFWGKPPLSFWATAASFTLFGVNEFAARLPPLLFTLATAWLLYYWVASLRDAAAARVVVLVYLCSFLVLHTAGAVITDPLLTLTTSLVMVGFWQAVVARQRYWGDVMWIALGLGLMTKGPVALVLCGLSAGAWVLVTRQWRGFFSAFHWLTGPALMLIVGAPWYWLAEQATAGFLQYFLVGEHFERYTTSTWAGDPYGAVKDMPPGTIWVYLIAAALPWVLIAALRMTSATVRNKLRESKSDGSSLVYLVCWIVLPCLFFTGARNILITYVLPAMPAVAVLVALNSEFLLGKVRFVYGIGYATVVIYVVSTLIAYPVYLADNKYNQKPVIDEFRRLAANDPGPLVYTGNPKFSATFYMRGDVTFSRHIGRIFLTRSGTLYLAVRERWYASMKRMMGTQCDEIMRSNDVSLWYCPASRLPKPADIPIN